MKRSPAIRRNIEVKVRCPDLAAARRQAKKIGAKSMGVMQQTDTYFHVPKGRLKLREVRGQGATLIWYDRPNRAAARDSQYHLVPAPDATLLKTALAVALGVRAIVKKRREWWLYKNVRIHLDRVEGLGDFLELEAVVGTKTNENALASERNLHQVIESLSLSDAFQISGSYGEMVSKTSYKNDREQ